MRISWGVLLLLCACVSEPPVLDYTLARTAWQSAKSSHASKYAAAYWQKADEEYLEGEKLYKAGKNSEAEQKFHSARELAEKAENVARVKKFNSGEDLP